MGCGAKDGELAGARRGLLEELRKSFALALRMSSRKHVRRRLGAGVPASLKGVRASASANRTHA